MKKTISLFLVIALAICFCGCDSGLENNNYKKIEYQNDEIFEKVIVFTIPDVWVYAERFDEDNSFIVFRDVLGQQIGNIALNTIYSGEDDIFSAKEKIVPIDDAKYTKISENCFITTDKGRGNIITYKVKDVVIDMFFNVSVEKDIVKQIAENIAIKDFEVKEDKEETISSSPSSSSSPSTNIIINQKPNIDFIEEPGLVNNAIAVEKIYDVYNAVGCNMYLMGRPNIGKEIYFENNYNTSTLQLYGDDGYMYMLIDNFRNKKFELARLSEPGRSANIQNRDVILSKSLPADCNLLTEYNEYMYNFASQKSFINFEQADNIIMFPFLCQFLNEDSLMPEGFSVSEDGMIISTKLYIPEVMAFLYITENYKYMQAEYRIAAVNGDTSHLSQDLNKYNTIKELRNPSGMFQPTDRFRYKEFGVIFP